MRLFAKIKDFLKNLDGFIYFNYQTALSSDNDIINRKNEYIK